MSHSVLLIRHGQSLHNADDNSFSGVTDVKMDEIGYAQCRRLAAFFDRCPVDCVFASPLHRARESARLIFPGHWENLGIAHWLTEFDYGDYEGKRPIDLGDDTVFGQWNTTPAELVFPGGDSIREHAEQIRRHTLIRPVEHGARVELPDVEEEQIAFFDAW
jgi:broad specificity phosphatase PhoE